MRVQIVVEAAQGEESMGLFTVEELREVISVKVLAGQGSLSGKRRIRQISTDSRSVRRGDLFVALRGDRFDGHEFVPAVLAQGRPEPSFMMNTAFLQVPQRYAGSMGEPHPFSSECVIRCSRISN